MGFGPAPPGTWREKPLRSVRAKFGLTPIGPVRMCEHGPRTLRSLRGGFVFRCRASPSRGGPNPRRPRRAVGPNPDVLHPPTVTSRRARVVRPRDDGVMIRRRCGFGAARQRSSEAAAQEARRSRAESAEIRHCRPSPARSRASLRIAARRAEGGGPAGGRPRPRSCWGGSRRHQLGSLDSLPRASDRHLPPFRDRFLTAEVDRFPDQADWCGRQRAIVHQRDGSYVDEDANEPQ